MPNAPVNHYDYVIAGGGMAGLSLAYYLNHSPLRDRRVLVLDRDDKVRNDRTWSFWQRGPSPFDHLLYQQWPRAWFHGTGGFSQNLDLGQFRYKVLRGLDFYQFVQADLANNPRISFRRADIRGVESTPQYATVRTDAGDFTADIVFDSTHRLAAMEPFAPDFSPRNGHVAAPTHPTQHRLLQHFKGWEIKTALPTFDADEPILMDFRIPQRGECRFMYVLPASSTEALVEFTLFTPRLLTSAEYDEQLQQYLADYLGITQYHVQQTEFGIIPMSDEPTREFVSQRVVRIGTAGGNTRPSTGYTFARTQRRLQQLVANLLATDWPHDATNPVAKPFLLFDSVLLNVLEHHRHDAADVFTHLYANNPTERLLRFLDEDITPAEGLKIMASVPLRPFLVAAADVARRKLFG